MSYLSEAARQIPQRERYDTVVAGGGIAGIAAALASARHGAKTLLIEREYTLGGLATLGLVTIYLPLCDGLGTQWCYGIVEELLKLSISRGCEARYPTPWLEGGDREARARTRYEVQFNANLFALLAEQLLVEAGVEILYGTAAVAVHKEGDRISHVIVENKSGRLAYPCGCAIDATGDALLCLFAGEETALYGPGNTPAGWYYHTKDGGIRLKMLGYAEDPNVPAEHDGSLPHFAGVDADEVSRMTLRSHASTLRDFLSCGELTDTHALTAIAGIPQLRMTRRLVGRYTMDITEEHTRFEDSIGLITNWRRRGPVYELPYRILYGKTTNLAVAGRICSVTDKMWDISRVIPPCAVMGQAVGTAAALFGDFATADVPTLQNALVADGVLLHTK